MRLRELAAGGQLRPADMVLLGGATHWTQALSVEGLFPLPNTLASQGAGAAPGGRDGEPTPRHFWKGECIRSRARLRLERRPAPAP